MHPHLSKKIEQLKNVCSFLLPQGKRIGKKKKTSVKSNNLNPYWNESFVFLIDEYDMKKVFLDVTVRNQYTYITCE